MSILYHPGVDGVLRYQGRFCVPRVDELHERIMEESHSSRYSIHPGFTRRYRDMREVYWCSSMKKGIATFVAKCPNCQQVKIARKVPMEDGEAECTIETLEYMLRACVVDFKRNWVINSSSGISHLHGEEVHGRSFIDHSNGRYWVKDTLSYKEIPVQILDHQVQKMRTQGVASLKALWINQFIEEATWEVEEDMKKIYPHLL
ncbi:hypothetical protein EJD97_017631 [Solanum chilense]|uniref:Integrase zinc-binding domain-containing protein n=1 Tax=Solanum chilense TaxID=4083 RepID=A0A6N2CCR3_SOLCI|nr:hypothetical protein EJD97_017631 [Solanum chilense]